MKTFSKLTPLAIFLAFISLLGAIWAGWSRIGWLIPVSSPSLILYHGPLMIMGFLGSLISLERAVALNKKWMFVAPLAFAAAGFMLVIDLWILSAKILLISGSLFLFTIQVSIIRTQKAMHTWILLGGSLAGFIGNILWFFNHPTHRVVWWWALFLVFTIAGERLELGRVLRLSRASKILFLFICLLVVVGLITISFAIPVGYPMIGAGTFGLGIWLLQFDIARRTVKQPGKVIRSVTHYIAYSLLLGFCWLVLSGLLLLLYGFYSAGLIYDAILHTLFIGFVISMIFGHAPIILPSIFGLQFVFKPVLYVPLLLLHLSLALRIFGDLSRQVDFRLWGGILNGVAILLFMASMLGIIGKSKLTPKR